MAATMYAITLIFNQTWFNVVNYIFNYLADTKFMNRRYDVLQKFNAIVSEDLESIVNIEFTKLNISNSRGRNIKIKVDPKLR